jgi:hypothetical protein
MKSHRIDYRSTLWRGRNGRLWRLADHFEAVAQDIRYAKKPYDLVYPVTRFTELTNQVRQMQWDWLAECIGLNRKNAGRWPNI